MKRIVLYSLVFLFIQSCTPQTIPTVISGDATNITPTTVTCAGSVTSDGGAPITARGVCWSTSQFPTISDSKTNDGTGLGTFTSKITGLSPNTKYYVMAYATNAKGIAYGEQKTFTTNHDLPTVVTGSITNITSRTASFAGSVIADGGATIKARGFSWSTSQIPMISDSKTYDGTGSGDFTRDITDLSPNTTYYLRAYATNIKGTAYGEQKTFTTNKEIPTVVTGTTTNITSNTATWFGSVTADGGATVTARGVCWSTSQFPTILDSKTSNGNGLGSFTSYITDLSPNTTYYLRAYATNSLGTAYGNEMSFTTLFSHIEYGSFTDSRDRKVYKTVTIGEQEWMAENLAYLPAVSGPTTGSAIETHYYVYGYDGSDVAAAKATINYYTYGVLYNFEAANSACPDGWHLPSGEEWEQLITYLANSGYNYDGSTGRPNTSNKIAKSLATNYGWESSTIQGSVGNTDYPEYRNKSGFSALPTGYFEFGRFRLAGSYTFWWQFSDHDFIYEPGLEMYSDQNSTTIEYQLDVNGFAVRCVRD